jgi:hypothetical protein
VMSFVEWHVLSPLGKLQHFCTYLLLYLSPVNCSHGIPNFLCWTLDQYMCQCSYLWFLSMGSYVLLRDLSVRTFKLHGQQFCWVNEWKWYAVKVPKGSGVQGSLTDETLFHLHYPHHHHSHPTITIITIQLVSLLLLSSIKLQPIQSSAAWVLPDPECASQHCNWVLFSLCRLPVKFQINFNPLLTLRPLKRAVFPPSLVNWGLSLSLGRLSSWQRLCALIPVPGQQLPDFQAVGSSPPGLWGSMPRPPEQCQLTPGTLSF